MYDTAHISDPSGQGQGHSGTEGQDGSKSMGHSRAASGASASSSSTAFGEASAGPSKVGSTSVGTSHPHPNGLDHTRPNVSIDANATAGPSSHPQPHTYTHLHPARSPHPPAPSPAKPRAVNPLDPSTYFPQSYATGITRIPVAPSNEPFTSTHPSELPSRVGTSGTGSGGGSGQGQGQGQGPPRPGTPLLQMAPPVSHTQPQSQGQGYAYGYGGLAYPSASSPRIPLQPPGPLQGYNPSVHQPGQHAQYIPSYIPGEIPHESLLGPPQMGLPPHMMQTHRPHSIQVHGYPLEEWADWDEEKDDEQWSAEMVGQHVEVRHRRKTSPEQLKVLEHWFNINPKPDNHMREWLAAELGMTKRNIQVWFQNRRAKIKSNAFKNISGKKGDTLLSPDALKTPERQISNNLALGASPGGATGVSSPADEDESAPSSATAPAPLYSYPSYPGYSGLNASPLSQGALPLSGPAMNGGRRVSLANGEAERIQVWAAKRTAQSGLAFPKSPMGVGALMGGTAMGQAAAARRGSIPYPYPAGNGYLSQVSPRISPSVRHTPSALHLAAIRNNTTRRSSMPGAPQLISSGAFTPPRVVDGAIQPRAQALDPIRDDHELIFGAPQPPSATPDGFVFGSNDSGLPTTYLTPPQTSFYPSESAASSDSMLTGGEIDYTGGAAAGAAAGMLYTPAGPLPAPGFSFGSAPSTGPTPHLSISSDTPAGQPFAYGQAADARTREMELFFQFRDKGRLDSMASASGYASDGTTGTANGSMGQAEPWEWAQGQMAGVPGQQVQPQGQMLQVQGHGHDLQVQSAGLEGLQLPMGFNADRRASAPDGLQHDLGMLGLELHGNQLGPSAMGHGTLGDQPGAGDINVPSIALHGSQDHQRPLPLNITTNKAYLGATGGSGPNSAVDTFTLSPIDMSTSPHSGSLMSAHSHSSGGPSPDAQQSMGQPGMQQGMKASQSMPLPQGHGHVQHFTPYGQPEAQMGQHQQQQQQPLWLDLSDPSLQGLPVQGAQGETVQGQHGQSVSAPTTAFMGCFGSS